MKRTALLSVILVFGFFVSMRVSAQCEPDTVNCEDIGDPGQFCPLQLPHAGLHVLYDETITVIPPGAFAFEDLQLSIIHIRIDSVKNMPPGIDYFPNADILYPDTAYCIQLSGTPTEVGVDTLSIYITALVDILGGIEYQVVDDSSVSITVVEVLGSDPEKITGFHVSQNVPNPFPDVTRMAYYSPTEETVELCVYNILGVRIHREFKIVAPGEHTFDFDGSNLEPGIYLYSVASSDARFTGKLIKSR